MSESPFWKHTALNALSSAQWESLCDGCGKCCVLKLEDMDTGEIYSTDVGCKLLDCQTARCKDYENRKALVPDCVILSPDNLQYLSWMPKSCAYRCIYEGRDLPEWHPLITGTYDSVRTSGHSVAGRILPEQAIEEADLPDHITNWDNEVQPDNRKD